MLENYLIDLPNKKEVSCRSWQNECVVYNSVSGEIHLLESYFYYSNLMVSDYEYRTVVEH